ncbi:hypothetical protein BaRGS_00017895, partial [Batillaria attramentaria]
MEFSIIVGLVNEQLVVGDIHKNLRYFETLETVNVVSRTRRDADGKYQTSKEISFQALGRNFNLVLYPGTPVLASDFEVNTVDKYGEETPYFVDPNEILTGHLADDKSVIVEAHFEDGILSSSIQFHNETYAVEPAWRHLPAENNRTMIVYRGADIIWNNGKNKRFCGGIRLGKHNASFPLDENWNECQEKKGQKRAANKRKSCTLLIVADYLFYRDIGHSSVRATTLYM